MSDELRKAQEVATQCEALLNYPIFGKTVTLLEQQLFDDWKNSNSVEERETKFNEYLGLKRIVEKLVNGMHEAELITAQLQAEQEDQHY